MSEEVITPDTVPEEVDVAPAEGDRADESQISLDKLNEFLGKNFKDVDTALKSVKDTYSYVGQQDEIRQSVKALAEQSGKGTEDVLKTLEKLMTDTTEQSNQSPASQDGAFIPKDQYLEDRFFDKNADYETIRDIIKPLKTTQFNDMSWDEFAKTEKVQGILQTYSGYNEAQNKKSVVESNPRLGVASDKVNKSRQAFQEGNMSQAADQAVSAVIDTILE